MKKQDEFMAKAIDIAKDSGKDLPIGAIVVYNNSIIASSCNCKELLNSSILHAEIVAIQEAQKKLNNWRLKNCEMYVTLEPCPMCAWAIIQSRINKVYFGAYDTLYGALGSAIDLRTLSNSDLKVVGGIMEEKCSALIKKYLRNVRDTNANKRNS